MEVLRTDSSRIMTFTSAPKVNEIDSGAVYDFESTIKVSLLPDHSLPTPRLKPVVYRTPTIVNMHTGIPSAAISLRLDGGTLIFTQHILKI
jgi:hypothetical protein